MSGEHGHPELADRVGSLEAAQSTTDAVARSLLARVATLEATPPPAPPPPTAGAATDPGVVDVDTFPGATFDDRLAAALAHAAAQTHKPTIRLPHGATTWTRTVNAFTGMKITGAGGGVSVEQPRSGNPYATLINFKGTDPTRPMILWPAGQTFGTFVGHLAVSGTSSSTIFGCAASSAVAWRAVFRDLGIANARHVFGTPAQKFLATASTWDGDHNYNNVRGDGVTVGGSDNMLWASGTCLIDSPTTLNGNVGAMFHAAYLEKSTVGGLYITCEGGPLGIRVSGSANTESLTFLAPRVEGRNAGKPSTGPVVRVDGGDATFLAPWFGYSTGPIVEVRGGDVLLDGPTFGRATGVAASVPDVVQTGGVLRVVNARRRPTVKSSGGSFASDGTPVRV